ncbi:MAG: F0F1 ATP synthase subunit A [Lachnospiraceae bacterium]|nr:F0F1 ATP synthase subunit A [Lachnospiraceae bacterium]
MKKSLVILVILLILTLVGIILTHPYSVRHETIKEAMRDAVLHNENKIRVFGLIDVDPSLAAGYVVTAMLLITAALIRIFAIPRFQMIPGKFQLLIEEWVGVFDRLARTNSPHKNSALGAYIFAAGSYIFVGTVFELFGVQGITTQGHSISLPAPLANINGAISMGCFSYLFILIGGITTNKVRGIGRTLKEFSLPISMTFRLFGALLSGMLTTELVYFYIQLSFVLPVVIGVLFTLLHALIQAYVLTMLTSVYYGEVTEVMEKKAKKKTDAGEK